MPDPIDRRQFLSTTAALAMLGGATITIGCGDSGKITEPPPPPPPPPPTGTDEVGYVGTNHGHVARITAAELQSTGTVILYIQGSAAHQHLVTLTPANIVTIRDGGRVAVTSSSGPVGSLAHVHTVAFN